MYNEKIIISIVRDSLSPLTISEIMRECHQRNYFISLSSLKRYLSTLVYFKKISFGEAKNKHPRKKPTRVYFTND